MEKNTKSLISGPLLHWTKVAILKVSNESLKSSTRISANMILMARQNPNRKQGEEDEETVKQIVKINYDNMAGVNKLISELMDKIPESMRSWPHSN